jgi:hypothetical protein
MRAIRLALAVLALAGGDTVMGQDVGHRVRLPSPSHKGGLSVEEALQQRRSVRAFGPGRLESRNLRQSRRLEIA